MATVHQLGYVVCVFVSASEAFHDLISTECRHQTGGLDIERQC